MISNINADDFRVKGENSALLAGWIFLLVIVLFFSTISLSVLFWTTLIAVTIGAIVVRIHQNNYIGGAAKVSEKQFPAIYAIAQEAAERLNMAQPDIFIKQDPTLNAFAIGFLGSKCVVLHSATVEGMERGELEFIIGHEFSHIKCNHTDLLLLTIPGFSPWWISFVANVFFGVWKRKAEYTADQGGLLAVQDPKLAIGGLAKLAVGPSLFMDMDIDGFLKQKMTLDQTEFTRLAESFSDHPYLVKRIHAILRYYDSEQYKRLVPIEG